MMIIRKPLANRWRVLLGVASVLMLGALYGYISHRQHQINPRDRTVPTFKQLYQDGVLKALRRPASGGAPLIWADTKATFGRLAWGLGVSVGISLVLGLLMGCYAPVEAFLLPPLAFLAKIPPTAMLAIFFVLTRSDQQLFVSMIAFGLIPTMAQSIFHAAREDVPDELLDKARTLGASQVECIWDVILRQILPKVLDTVRLQIGPAMVYLIAAELMVGDVGLGCRMRILFKKLDMSIVYVYLLWLGLAGFTIDAAFRRLQRWLCPWFGLSP